MLRGCGWFDSSMDLHQGLNVVELDLPQARQASVPLGWWMRWELGLEGLPSIARPCG